MPPSAAQSSPSTHWASDPPSTCSMFPVPQRYGTTVLPSKGKFFHPSFISAKLYKLFPLMKFPGESVDNCSVHRAEKNIEFKISFQKLYIILVPSKHLGKFTLDSSIYSCWKRKKTHKLIFLSFFKCTYFLTLPTQCFLNNWIFHLG